MDSDMSARQRSRGHCAFCGRDLSSAGMAKHLAACPVRKEAIVKADQAQREREALYHLQVQDAWAGDYWLQLEMNGTGRLRHLDEYLRAIWLECCGHMSRFSIGGWSGEEIGKDRMAKDVFRVGDEITHIYDFGTSSETMIKVVAKRNGKPLGKHPIHLVARNEQPEARCSKCEQQAVWLCLECVYELEESGLLCEQHAKPHPHEEYGGLTPVVNSPRVGMCGYEGPAEPPY